MAKALVAYFSASGVTAGLAKKLASSIGADIFEIVPLKRYNAADLDYRDASSRSSIEMNDRTCRPEISTKTDISPYDVIFLGFPIWWFREPSIIDTFVESYDFTGKTIVPFATSGGTDIGSSRKNIGELVKGAKVEEGKRFSAEIPENKLKEWASSWI
ncbi:MAG: hypothetical protein IKM91_08230 [Candidatus Methanomethylophilaceae archaeon]|jgi:flavodoxin|nr:flavodoxin [Thermoplasmata archaeon]MBR3410487.1 hypothetical protein [Candidatus Methanomethylophilaceae archaeon]MBR3476672.1 hypothetical protein [Candidatus Methanomethylophilaceae archaeon]MBR4181040.1 hypothetical protein [Candidatus Methanomethylophilaceae archaeon]MBR4217002.1 hypothetical protein [Candidatus Methanomethylophilaceae archaeon]